MIFPFFCQFPNISMCFTVCVIRINEMHFLFKFIPINILYMFQIDYLFILRRQFTVHAVFGIYPASTLTSF